MSDIGVITRKSKDVDAERSEAYQAVIKLINPNFMYKQWANKVWTYIACLNAQYQMLGELIGEDWGCE